MDNWITIGTKLDTKQLEKDLRDSKRKLQQYEKEVEKLTEQKIKIETEIDFKQTEFERKIKQIQDKAKIDVQAISSGSYYVRKAKEQKIEETAQLKINQLTQQYEQYLEQADNKITDIEKSLEKNAYQQGLVNNNIDEMSSKLKQVRGFSNIKDSVENVGKSVQKVTRKIGKMALAVFAIRSAFMFVRNAINTIAGDDEQLKADIDYIKSAIAYTIEPIVRTIVDLIKQLMQYLGYIIYQWTGKNIFENANKGLAKANKQAKELKKTTANFDDMNVLSDNSSSSNASPSFDLSKINGDVPEWIDWIAKNGNKVKKILFGIAGGLVALKLGLNLIKSIGIGLALYGIAKAMDKIIDFIKDPSFENFIGILEGIAIAVTGVAIAFSAWPVAIGGAVAYIVLQIVKHFDEIKEMFNKFIEWMDTNFLNALRNLFGPLGDILYLPFKYGIELVSGAFEGFYGGIKRVIDGVVKMLRGDFLGGVKDVFGGLLDTMTAPLRGFVRALEKTLEQIKDSLVHWINKLWDSIKQPISNLAKKIGDALNPSNLVSNVGKGIGNIGKGIKNLFGFAKGGIVVPKLASGGIINQPGRGVPLASAIGGERGAEGVLPLTDSQQMMLLGEAIGRYITINANITNTMNGRVISRELQKVQNDNDFAYNR